MEASAWVEASGFICWMNGHSAAAAPTPAKACAAMTMKSRRLGSLRYAAPSLPPFSLLRPGLGAGRPAAPFRQPGSLHRSLDCQRTVHAVRTCRQPPRDCPVA